MAGSDAVTLNLRKIGKFDSRLAKYLNELKDQQPSLFEPDESSEYDKDQNAQMNVEYDSANDGFESPKKVSRWKRRCPNTSESSLEQTPNPYRILRQLDEEGTVSNPEVRASIPLRTEQTCRMSKTTQKRENQNQVVRRAKDQQVTHSPNKPQQRKEKSRVSLKITGLHQHTKGNPSKLKQILDSTIKTSNIEVKMGNVVTHINLPAEYVGRAIDVKTWENYPGVNVKVAQTKSETNQKTKVVATRVPTNLTTDEIKKDLTESNDVMIKSVTRLSHKGETPIQKVIVEFETEAVAQAAITNGVYLFYQKHTCISYRSKPSVTLCYKCYSVEHTGNECQLQKRRCTKCNSEAHGSTQCPNQEPNCIHCQGKHSSTYKGCPVLRKKQEQIQTTAPKTYGQAVTQGSSSPNMQNLLTKIYTSIMEILHTLEENPDHDTRYMTSTIINAAHKQFPELKTAEFETAIVTKESEMLGKYLNVHNTQHEGLRPEHVPETEPLTVDNLSRTLVLPNE